MTWQQFAGTILAIAAVAAERLLNRYLPARAAKRAAEPTGDTEPA